MPDAFEEEKYKCERYVIALSKNYLPLNKVNKGTIVFEAIPCTLHKINVNESKYNVFVVHLFQNIYCV